MQRNFFLIKTQSAKKLSKMEGRASSSMLNVANGPKVLRGQKSLARDLSNSFAYKVFEFGGCVRVLGRSPF